MLTDPEWQFVDPDPPEQPAVQEGDLQVEDKRKENFRNYLKMKKKNFNNGMANNGTANNGTAKRQKGACQRRTRPRT